MELPERAVLKNSQKEQEREKRRLRDRQRRQAMTVEEKEKHLARRRRNYQLRRQRAQTAVSDPQLDQASLVDGGETLMLPSNENNQAIVSVPLQSNGSLVTFDQRQQSLNAGITISAGLDVSAHRLAKLPVRSRLNHIKHLARSVDDTSDKGDNHKIATDLIINGNETSNRVPQNAVRLNRVKHLARALSSDLSSPTIQNHESETAVEQDLLNGDPLMSIDLPKVV